MKFNSIRDIAILGLAVLALSLPGVSKAGGFSQIYIFGDSLSDPGNIYTLTGETSKAPYLPIPDAAYAIGGHQFSNGKTWAQRFAQNMNLNNGGKAALDAPGKNGNYAFGGARARTGSGSLAPSASDQVTLYLADHANIVDSNALYVIQFGGNDVRDALDVLLTDPGAILGILQSAVEATITNIALLYGSGARHFLVATAPNLARTPAVRAFGEPVIGFASDFAMAYNVGLEIGLGQLEVGYPDIKIHRIDFFAIVNTVADDPGLLGITEIDLPCLEFGVHSDAKCADPEEYLFWDGIHPTTVVHNEIGDKASDLFSGD